MRFVYITSSNSLVNTLKQHPNTLSEQSCSSLIYTLVKMPKVATSGLCIGHFAALLVFYPAIS